jgi:NADH-quinone oxidoreductase subunit H
MTATFTVLADTGVYEDMVDPGPQVAGDLHRRAADPADGDHHERKLMGRLQMRYGPNRVGPFGSLQPLAEILKFADQADSRPRTASRGCTCSPPAISIITAISAFAIIPFGDTVDIFGTQVGLYGIDVSIGVLYVFAFGAIAFYG